MENSSGFKIPIAKPYFTGEETELVAEVIKTGWLVQGPMVLRFEEEVAQYTQAKHAVATTSCTTALHLAMIVHGIGPGDDVICPSYSFIATANGITYSGAKPQFVDIDPATLNLCPKATDAFIDSHYSPDLLHRKTGSRLKAILLVHQIGIPGDIDAFEDICKRRGIALIEDAACAIGSTYKGKPIGSSGNVATLSFHPRKVITCGEGGMVLTSNEAFAEKARVYRAHGASISDLARHKAGSSVYESYNVVGYNYRMTDLQAAVGVKQMELLDWVVERRTTIAKKFNAAFGNLDQIEIIEAPAYSTCWNYQSYPLRLRTGGPAQRDTLMQRLEAEGVSTRRGIPPIHKEPVYETGVTLPATESVSNRSLFLPIYPQLTDAEVDHIIASVKKCLATLPSPVRA